MRLFFVTAVLLSVIPAFGGALLVHTSRTPDSSFKCEVYENSVHLLRQIGPVRMDRNIDTNLSDGEVIKLIRQAEAEKVAENLEFAPSPNSETYAISAGTADEKVLLSKHSPGKRQQRNGEATRRLTAVVETLCKW